MVLDLAADRIAIDRGVLEEARRSGVTNSVHRKLPLQGPEEPVVRATPDDQYDCVDIINDVLVSAVHVHQRNLIPGDGFDVGVRRYLHPPTTNALRKEGGVAWLQVDTGKRQRSDEVDPMASLEEVFRGPT
jgi:hypothetical protein